MRSEPTIVAGYVVDHQPAVVGERIEDRARTARLDVLVDLRAHLVGGSRCGDHLDDVVGHQLAGRDHPVLSCGPGEHLADLVEQLLGLAGRLTDVGLFP